MVDCDAIQYAVGAVLLREQDDNKTSDLATVGYWSKSLSKQQKNYSAARKGILRRGLGGLHSAPLRLVLSLLVSVRSQFLEVDDDSERPTGTPDALAPSPDVIRLRDRVPPRACPQSS